MSETLTAPNLEAFDWNSVEERKDGYTKKEREDLESLYEKTLKQVTNNEVVEGTVLQKMQEK